MFLAIVIFHIIISLTFMVNNLRILFTVFILTAVFFIYCLAGKRLGRQRALSIPAICIFLFSIGFYCEAVSQSAKVNAKFLLS